eukprot:gene9070-10038_t
MDKVFMSYASMTQLSKINVEDWRRYFTQTDTQQELINKVLKCKHAENFPVSTKYKLRFMKVLIDQLESCGIEVIEEIYNEYLILLHKDIAEDYCFKTYFFQDGKKIISREATSMLSSGTTGLVPWQAAFKMCEWVNSNPEYFNGKKILELGCGSGFLGMFICKSTKICDYLFTDCHDKVLDYLRINLAINSIKVNCDCGNLLQGETTTNVEAERCNNIDIKESSAGFVLKASATHPIVKATVLDCDCCRDSEINNANRNKELSVNINKMDWTNFQSSEYFSGKDIDIIIGSDLVFDCAIIPSLVDVIKYFLSKSENTVALISSTIRNTETYEFFLHCLVESNLNARTINQLESNHLFEEMNNFVDLWKQDCCRDSVNELITKKYEGKRKDGRINDNKMQNKERAGGGGGNTYEKKSSWRKSPGSVSVEYKTTSKSFAASFRKTDQDDDVDYEDGNIASTPDQQRFDKNAEQLSLQGMDNSNSTEKSKNSTGKAGGKVGDVSTKTLWMKDKVANLWSWKNKTDVNEKSDSQNEVGMQTVDQAGNFESCDKLRTEKAEKSIDPKDFIVVEKSQEVLSSSPEMESENMKDVDKEIKDKKMSKAKTGWIRDQVSSLISKGRNYTTTTVSNADKDAEETKSIDGMNQSKSNESNLAASMMEHYNLKQKGDEADKNIPKGDETKAPKPHPSPPKGGNSISKKEKFADIHENISKKLPNQPSAVLTKDSAKVQDRPLSPQASSTTAFASKSASKALKIKEFLNARPPTTDLTHLPPPMIEKNGRERETSPSSIKAQAKKKFNFSTKLSFSELLHSQETGQLTPEQETKNGDRPGSQMASPTSNRIDEEISTDEESVEIPYKDANSNNNTEYSASHKSQMTYVRLWLLSVLLYAYTIIPTHSFLNGLVLGAFVMYLCGCLIIWLFCPSGKSIEQYKLELKNYIKEQEKSTPIRKLARSVDPKTLQKPRDLKGWVHFIIDYEPRVFTLDSTKDVFAVLRGETLYIFFCKAPPVEMNASPQKLKKVKRGLRRRRNRRKNELQQNGEPAFVFEKQHKILLPSCQMDLCPLDLPMRRIWNRKYPIRIEVPAHAMFTRDINVPFEDLTADFDDFFDDTGSDWTEGSVDEKFHIFPNTAREKEDWFYRMQLCVKALKHQVTFSDARKGYLSTAPIESYPHYMTECIRDSEKVTSRVINGKKMEPHSAWLNVLIGRAFWDVWHEEYWKRKVWQKIQNRLSKLNTPPIIKEIFVKDLQLGHTLPIIHRGTLPELDEYGVWTDLQVTYVGEFTLTLETQLNVDFYVQLLTNIAKKQAPSAEGHSSSTDGVRMKVVREKSDEDHADNSTDASAEPSVESGDIDSTDGLDDEQLPEIFLEAMDNVAVDEEDLGATLDDDPLISDPRTKAFLESKTGKRVIGVVGWLARSKIAKKVAGTDFAKRAYEKAYEKFRKMPITLKVTVQSLKGTLAVNIPPPPSNRLWFGFRGSPALLITAHPKLGERHVRLTYLTDWIEKKLKEEFKKLFVLPSMQDISVKLMYSRLEELYPDRPLS